MGLYGLVGQLAEKMTPRQWIERYEAGRGKL